MVAAMPKTVRTAMVAAMPNKVGNRDGPVQAEYGSETAMDQSRPNTGQRPRCARSTWPARHAPAEPGRSRLEIMSRHALRAGSSVAETVGARLKTVMGGMVNHPAHHLRALYIRPPSVGSDPAAGGHEPRRRFRLCGCFAGTVTSENMPRYDNATLVTEEQSALPDSPTSTRPNGRR
jgi:hypothetical protein